MCSNKHVSLEEVKILVENGTDVKKGQLILILCQNAMENFEIIKFLHSQGAMIQPLALKFVNKDQEKEVFDFINDNISQDEQTPQIQNPQIQKPHLGLKSVIIFAVIGCIIYKFK